MVVEVVGLDAELEFGVMAALLLGFELWQFVAQISFYHHLFGCCNIRVHLLDYNHSLFLLIFWNILSIIIFFGVIYSVVYCIHQYIL